MTDKQEERHHTDTEYDELKAKLDELEGIEIVMKDKVKDNNKLRAELADAEVMTTALGAMMMPDQEDGMHGSTDEQLDAMEMYRWRAGLTWILAALLIIFFLIIVGGIEI